MSLNLYTKSVETKLYFVVFVLFASFLTLVIYNLASDVTASADQDIADATGPFQRHIRAISAATSSDVGIAGWKTYRNEKYGFEVKYPANFQIQSNDSGSRPDSPWYFFSILGPKHLIYLRLWIRRFHEISLEEFSYEHSPAKFVYNEEVQQKVLNEIKGLEDSGFEGSEEGCNCYFDQFNFLRESNVWTLYLDPVLEGKVSAAEFSIFGLLPNRDRGVYKKIVDSFRFIQ